MSSGQSQSEMTTLVLDERERGELLQLLEQSLGETRVEVHHTHTPVFREQVKEREEILRRLIAKLRPPGS